jgi:predicted anti-sigma-YlaC factor YlaD
MGADQESKKCKKYEMLLEDYLSGTLQRGKAARVAAHLGSCAGCREALAEARVSVSLVSVMGQEVEDPGPNFTHRVMARINVAEEWVREQSNFWKPLEVLSWRLAFTAALALVFLFAYDVRLSAPETPPSLPTAFAQHTDIALPRATAPPSTGDDVLLAIAERTHGR